MTLPHKDDRLLFITRLVLTALLGLMILVGTVAIIMAPIMLFNQELMASRLAESQIHPGAVPWIAALLLCAAAIIALAFLFVRHLRRIVDSVSQGDPFVPINADRLRHMAWLALAMQVILIPATGLLVWFDSLPHEPNVHYIDNSSFGGVILALLLFVLARVFRVGAAMREELEGTV